MRATDLNAVGAATGSGAPLHRPLCTWRHQALSVPIILADRRQRRTDDPSPLRISNRPDYVIGTITVRFPPLAQGASVVVWQARVSADTVTHEAGISPALAAMHGSDAMRRRHEAADAESARRCGPLRPGRYAEAPLVCACTIPAESSLGAGIWGRSAPPRSVTA